MKQFRIVLAIAIMAGMACVAPLEAQEASGSLAVFSRIGFEEALAGNASPGVVLLVDAMAAWCPPCREMERTTWQDPAVLAWVASHGQALQFNVDEDKALATRLNIEEMPTVLVFREGREADRKTGFQDARTMLSWLDGVLQGKTQQQVLEEKAATASGTGATEVEARLDLAQTLLSKGELERATEEYVWLWVNIPLLNEDMMAVRGSFLAADMEELAGKHAPARERFRALREPLRRKVDSGTATTDEADDWFVLNDVVGEGAESLRWFDEAKTRPEAAPFIASLSMVLARKLSNVGRNADAGNLVQDPVTYAEEKLAMLRDMAEAPEYPGMVGRLVGQPFIWCLAAKRLEAAEAIAKKVLAEVKDNPETKRELLRTALEAGQDHPLFDTWLTDLASAGKDIKELEFQRAKNRSGK